MELLLSQEKSAHILQLTQLQQQVEALEADKNSAVQNYDDLSKSMQCASNKADGATSQVTHLQNEIEAVKQVQLSLERLSDRHRHVNSVHSISADTSEESSAQERPIGGSEKLI